MGTFKTFSEFVQAKGEMDPNMAKKMQQATASALDEVPGTVAVQALQGTNPMAQTKVITNALKNSASSSLMGDKPMSAEDAAKMIGLNKPKSVQNKTMMRKGMSKK